jgi:hypothetical protein
VRLRIRLAERVFEFDAFAVPFGLGHERECIFAACDANRDDHQISGGELQGVAVVTVGVQGWRMVISASAAL